MRNGARISTQPAGFLTVRKQEEHAFDQFIDIAGNIARFAVQDDSWKFSRCKGDDGHTIGPNQAIVMGIMNQEHIRIINWVARIDSAGLRRIVLQVDLGQPALLSAQDLKLILEVVLWRLVDNEIQFQITHLLCRHLAHIIGQLEGRATTAIPLWTARFGRQVPVMLDTSKGIQITTMDVPGENFQTSHATVPLASRWSATSTPI